MSDGGDAPVPPSPIDLSARARGAVTDAVVWLSLAAMLLLAWHVASSLLLILAGIVFAAGLQGGERLLGRVWNVRRSIRLGVVILLFLVAVLAFLFFAGTQIAAQAGQLQATLVAQSERLSALAKDYGLSGGNSDPIAAMKAQIGNSVGKILTVLGGVAGVVGSIVLIIVFGIFVAADPRLY